METFSSFCRVYDCTSAPNVAGLGNIEPTYVVMHDEIDRRYTMFRNFEIFKEAFDAYCEHAKDQREYTGDQTMYPHLHEYLRGNTVQRVRFDVDCDYDKIKNYTGDHIDQLVDDIIDASIEVLSRDFTSPYPVSDDEFIVCVSKRTETEKISIHVLTPIYGETSLACAGFFSAVIKLLNYRKVDMVEFIDLGVHKAGQNFRMPLCTKIRSTRIKMIPEDLPWDAAMVGYYDSDPVIHIPADETSLGNSLVDRKKSQTVAYTIIEQLLVGHIESFHSVWEFRNERDGAFYFNRLQPSLCTVCGREHEKDHTLFVTVGSSVNKPVYVHCRRNPKSIRIGHVSPEAIGNEKMNLLKQALENSPLDDDIDIGSPSVDASNDDDDVPVIQATPRSFVPDDVRVMEFNDPKLQPFPLCHTLYVRAQMKMGKTNELINYISKLDPPPKSIVFVSFRVTFTSSVINRLNESGFSFERYSDINQSISIKQHPYLIIQVDSLHRLQDMQNIDLLVLDECESVLAQFTSPHIMNLSKVFAPFSLMMRRAKRVIAMDANLGERTFRIVRQLRPQTNLLGAVDSIFYDATYQNAVEDTYHITTNFSDLTAEIIREIKQHKKIAFVSNSLEKAKAIYTAIKEEFNVYDLTVDRRPDDDPTHLKIAMYTSKTSITLRDRHFRDVHQHWANLDVLIYTPTVTAGISFELKHFDIVFGSFTSMSCDVETSRQMLGRIRDVSERKYVIHFDVNIEDYPIDRDIITLLLEDVDSVASRLGYAEHHSPIAQTVKGDKIVTAKFPYFDLVVENIRHHNMSRNRFYLRFINQIRHTGAKVCQFVPPLGEHDGPYFFVARELAEKYDISIAEKIVAVDPLEDDAFEVVRQAKRGRYTEDTIILERDNHAYTKRMLMQIYELRAESITVRVCMRFGTDRAIHAFTVIRDFKGSITWLALMAEKTIARRYEELRITHKKRDDSFSRGNRLMKHGFAVQAMAAFGIEYIGQKHDTTIAVTDLSPIIESFTRFMRQFIGDAKSSITSIVQHEFGTAVRDQKQALFVCARHFCISIKKQRDVFRLTYDTDLLDMYVVRDHHPYCSGDEKKM